MKFIICIVCLLFLTIASNEAGSLRKQSLQQRAKSLKALVGKTNPQEASADKETQSKLHSVIVSELKEILSGFTHEKTIYEAASKYMCIGNLSRTLSVVNETIGSTKTVKLSEPCSEGSLFGRDLKLFYKHLEQCPAISQERNRLRTKVLDMERRLNGLRANYTRAREKFEKAHQIELDEDDIHGKVVESLDKLAKAIAKHLHKHYGTDVEPQTSSDITAGVDKVVATASTAAEPVEDPVQIANAQQEAKVNASAASPTSLLQVNPEGSGKGRIKQLQWTLKRLHERMRASHEVELNETKAIRKVWENQEQEWLRKIEAMNRALKDLIAQEGHFLAEGKVCNCIANLQSHYFASQDSTAFHIRSPTFYETGALEKHILENDAKLHDTSNSGNATALLQVPTAPVLDSAFEPQMCVSQALTFISNAAQNAAKTHNSFVEKYNQLLQNIDDMRRIGKLVTTEILPLMGSTVLKTVDEVFDKSMMHKTLLAGPDHREWVIGSNDYFNNMKRYYRFKAAAPGENVEFVFEKVDLECHYDYVQYYESMDCNDDVAKEAMYAKSSTRLCNTVQPGGGEQYPYTQGPVRLSGRCIYIKLYSDFMVAGNSLEMHNTIKKFEGVRARYNSIK